LNISVPTLFISFTQNFAEVCENKYIQSGVEIALRRLFSLATHLTLETTTVKLFWKYEFKRKAEMRNVNQYQKGLII